MCIVYFRFVQHHAFYAYRLAFSAITRNITTLNLLHTEIFNYLVFRNVQNFIHTKIFTYTVDIIFSLGFYYSLLQLIVLYITIHSYNYHGGFLKTPTLSVLCLLKERFHM